MKKHYLFPILIFICLLLPLISSIVNHNDSSDQIADPFSSINPIQSRDYSVITPALNITEYANRTDAGQPITLLYNAISGLTSTDSAHAILAPSWEGKNISVNLYNIYENRCWNLNPDFNGPEYTGVSKNISTVFMYDRGVPAAIKTEHGSDKVFYMGFVFGEVTNATMQYNDTSSKDILLNNTLNWMGLATTANILIFNNDPGTYATAYENSLTRLGYTTWETRTTISNYVSQVRDRDLVIWCCGTSFSVEDPTYFQDHAINYLNEASSHNMIVSGQDVGYCMDDNNADNDLTANNFYNNYLHANFLEDAGNPQSIQGVENDPISNQLQFFLNSSMSAYWADLIMPNILNNESLIYNWTSGVYGNQYNEDWYYRREINGSGPNDDCLLLFLEDEVNNGYTTGDKVWIEQELNIDRSEIVWAGINFDYWIYNTWAPYTGNFRIYVTINDTVVYTLPISLVDTHQEWLNSGMIPINFSAIPLPQISLKIGLEVIYGSNYNPDMKPMVMIDNFELYLQTKVTPAQINLKMDGIDVEGGIGYGYCNLTPSNSWANSPVQVNFTWSPSPIPDPNKSISVTFICDTNLFASKSGQTLYTADPSKTGLLLTADHGTNTTWTFQYYMNLPTGYWNHSFTISHPVDWTFIFASEPQFPAVNILNECVIGSLTVPTTNITNSPDGYWRFEANSPNYIQTVLPQIYNGSLWINSTNFRVTNLTRIICHIFNGTGPPPNLESSSINLTIIDPNEQLWYTNTTPIFTNGWAIFPNLTIFGTNTSGGIYEVSISWDNGLEAGYLESNFTIIHETEIVLTKPTDAVADQVTVVNYGELLLIRIGLNDTDRNELVKGIDLTLNWSQGGSPVQLNLIDLETGQYEIVLDTNDLPSIENYTVIINSSSSYFSNAFYNLKLIVTSETLLSSPQYPKIIEEWGVNTTIQVNYVRALDEVGLNDSQIMINWTLGPYSITQIGFGQYDIEINLSYAEITEYTLEINASKANCAFKILKIKLEVNTIETELLSDDYPRVVGAWNKNITIDLNYRTAIGLSGIDDSLIEINWSSSDYTIFKLGSGLYQIELNTSWCNLQEYLLVITASKQYYQNKTLRITVVINAVDTILAYQPIATVPYGENATIYLKYTDFSGTPIPSETDGSDIVSVNATFWVSYNILNEYPYQILISTQGLQETDLLNITAFKLNHKSQSVLVYLAYRMIFTSFTNLNKTVISLPMEENISILVLYNDTEHNAGIENATLTFYGYNNLSFDELSNGYYRINISAGNIADAYTILITINNTGYLENSIQFVLQIKNWDEFVTDTFWPLVATGPAGSSAYFSVVLENDFTETYFEDADVIYIWGSEIGNLTYNGNGNYSILLNTANKAPGTYSIVINATTKNGHLLVSKTVTLVISETGTSWWVRNSWIFGILGAVLAVAAGYVARNKWRERNWERKVKHIYILRKSGVPLYDKRLGGITGVEPSLVTSALIGISSIVQEIIDSKRELKTIDHMDNKILFSHGFHTVIAVLASVDLPIIRRRIAQLTNRFEYYYQKELSDWRGDVADFFGAHKIINEFFPIEEYIEDKKIFSEWMIEKLFDMYGLSGMVTLLTVELGLKDPNKIASGTGIEKKRVELILRTLRDLSLIDSDKNLAPKGKETLAAYKARKERYLKIIELAERRLNQKKI